LILHFPQFPIQLFALAYNLANFLRQLVLPNPIQEWTLTTLREELVKIGAKVVSHAKYLVFQLAEVAVPRHLFAALVERIGWLRLVCASG
jgi:DDE family transposase